MIPRYEPNYSFKEINKSLLTSLKENHSTDVEEKIRKYYGVKHAYLLSSGKTCLFTILKAINNPGIVLTPAYNCNVVPEAVMFAGYQPGLIDVALDTLNVSPEQYIEHFSDQVRAIFAVSLFGIPYDVRPLLEVAKKRHILVVEDIASALGATLDGQLLGTFGDVGVISFQTTKPVSGDRGGAIFTNDDLLAQKIETVIKNIPTQNELLIFYALSLFYKISTRRWLYPLAHWSRQALTGEEMYELVPLPSKPPRDYFTKCSSYSAELINLQWNKLSANFARRRKIADQYRKAVENNPSFGIPKIPFGADPVWMQFPLLVKDKLSFYRYMNQHHIDLTWTYRYSCAVEFHLSGFPNTETIAKSILSLPVYPDLSDDEVEAVCQAARTYSGSPY